MNNTNCNDRARLLRKVQQHGFAMLEANLFLDGHPCNRRALAYFEKQRDAYRKSCEEFERLYGPLRVENVDTACGWNWTQGPWPWESEAN